MDKLVSIVLPVYNGEKYLAQAIESVLQQTYKNLELIVINDCSTDRSEEIVLHYRSLDDRIKYHKNEVNLKLPRSLNKGFSYAQGEYYAWTSDDNYYDPTAVEQMVSYLETHSAVSMVCCDCYIIDEDNRGETGRLSVLSQNLLCQNTIGACFLYRRDIARKVGEYNPDLFLLEDYDYWVRIFLVGTIEVMHIPLYYYRCHKNSLTGTRKQEIIRVTREYTLKMLPTYEAANLPDGILFGYFDFLIGQEKKHNKKLVWKILIKHPRYAARKILSKAKRALKRKGSAPGH